MQRWYVAATQPSRELLAQRHLRNQDFEVFLPRRARRVRHAGKTTSVLSPLFPGYLFIGMDPSVVRWRSINGTIGVRHILCADERPLPLPRGFVERLHSLADEHGCIAHDDGLKAGDRAVVVGGPFADRVGTLLSMDGKGRVKLLIELLSASVPLEMQAENLLPA